MDKIIAFRQEALNMLAELGRKHKVDLFIEMETYVDDKDRFSFRVATSAGNWVPLRLDGSSLAHLVNARPVDVIIKEPGGYVTRDGRVIRIVTVQRGNSQFTCGGYLPSGEYQLWMPDGRIDMNTENDADIIKKEEE